jgi:DNA-directed RNA polymerase subunit H (RpoH/RPB5)
MTTICKKLSDLKKIFNTLTEKNGMLERRLYKVPSKLKNITNIELEEINKKPYYIIELARDVTEDDKRYIIIMIMRDIQLFNEKKKKMECIEYIKNIKNIEKTSLVIIYTIGNKEDGGKSYLQNLNSLENYYIKKDCFKFHDLTLFYSTDELLTNKMNHELQPSIIKLLKQDENKPEIDELYDKLTISGLEQLQQYCINDPVVKFYGAIPGDVFYLEYKSQSNGIGYNYRYVTNINCL